MVSKKRRVPVSLCLSASYSCIFQRESLIAALPGSPARSTWTLKLLGGNDFWGTDYRRAEGRGRKTVKSAREGRRGSREYQVSFRLQVKTDAGRFGQGLSKVVMCGIFFSLGTADYCHPNERTQELIKRRGPNGSQVHRHRFPCSDGDVSRNVYLTFVSSVLALRGNSIQSQPLRSDFTDQSILCWNGEAWKIFDAVVRGNDALEVFQLFNRAVKPSITSTVQHQDALAGLCHAISNISGPFSFVFFDRHGSRIVYGRDHLGRRSLLQGWDKNGDFKILSVRDGTEPGNFEEVDTSGIHIIDLKQFSHDSFSRKRAEAHNRFPVKIDTVSWTTSAYGSTISPLQLVSLLMNPPSLHKRAANNLSLLDISNSCYEQGLTSNRTTAPVNPRLAIRSYLRTQASPLARNTASSHS